MRQGPSAFLMQAALDGAARKTMCWHEEALPPWGAGRVALSFCQPFTEPGLAGSVTRGTSSCRSISLQLMLCQVETAHATNKDH